MKNLSVILVVLLGLIFTNCEFVNEPEEFNTHYINHYTWMNQDEEIVLNFNEIIGKDLDNPQITITTNSNPEVFHTELNNSELTVLSDGLGYIILNITINDSNNKYFLFLHFEVLNGYPINLYSGEENTFQLSDITEELPTFDSLAIVLDSLEHTIGNWEYENNTLNFTGFHPLQTTGRIEYYLEGNVETVSLLSIETSIRQVVMVELFTNTGCVNCPLANETVDEFMEEFEENISVVRYHANGTDPNDPMYLYNQVENDFRNDYYGLFFQPVLVVNGEKLFNSNDWHSAIQSNLSLSNNVYLGHSTSGNSEVIMVNIIIKSFAQLEGSFSCYAMLLESNIEFDAQNGETHHEQVMRDLDYESDISIEDQTGTYNPLHFQFEFTPPENYSFSNPNFQIVTFIQNDETKEIIQSNIHHRIIFGLVGY